MSLTKNTLQVPFVDLKAQYASIEKEVNRAITSVLESSAFILGPEVKAFEEEFAGYCGVKHAVGVDSGTSALELALRAFDIGPGDEVITVANTFIATTLAISFVGATPVLVDHNPDTYNIDVSKIEGVITERTKAIMPVHLYGQPVDMDPILEIARSHNLVVIEDACQAHGATYKGQRAGSMGDAAGFSFYPAKNLGAYGDGGMVVTNNDEAIEKLRLLRNYGSVKKYHHQEIGYNRRLDSVHAAAMRIKLEHLDEWNESRRHHAALYNELLADSDVVAPTEANFAKSVWHLYVVRAKNREALREYLGEKGVSTGIHYPIPIHQQPAYADLGYSDSDFPITSEYAGQILSLPMYPELTTEMIEYVVEMIKSFPG